jgi:hypothetical protein
MPRLLEMNIYKNLKQQLHDIMIELGEIPSIRETYIGFQKYL